MVQIITDSSVLYTVEQARANGFEAVPLCVSIGDLEGRDLQIDMNDFYGRIKNGQVPMSSQPPIGEVVDLFEKYKNDQIINISMADGLSGTYQSACMAKGMIEENDNITVINSKTLCGPHRYMTEKALQMKKDGCSAAEIIDWLNQAAENHTSFLIPQDFEFLRRGGRLTPLAATLGSILKLKPIMTQTPDGRRLDKFGVKRTMRAAIKEIVDHMKANNVGADHVIYISDAEAKKDAEFARSLIAEELPNAEIRMLDLHAAFVTQGGPQCVAIQYIKK